MCLRVYAYNVRVLLRIVHHTVYIYIRVYSRARREQRRASRAANVRVCSDRPRAVTRHECMRVCVRFGLSVCGERGVLFLCVCESVYVAF